MRTNRVNILSSFLTCVGLCCAATATPNPEVEPNDSKASATIADSGGPGMFSGDTITGTTTGTATNAAGPASADYFRTKTAAQPLGIYRHRLVLTTTGAAGHTGHIRGLTQNGSGNIVPNTDLIAQNNVVTTNTPNRFNQWYGFGKQEEFYYRVSGTSSTSAPYTATLSTTPVTPLVIASPLRAGAITITTPSGNTAGNTSLWVYNSNLEPIPGYSNDDPAAPSTSSTAILTRVYDPGTYYIAYSTRFLSNNLTSASDDRFRPVPLTDFPNIILNSSALAGDADNFPITLTDASGTATITGTRSTFDIVWVRFQVVPPPQPTPIAVTTQPATVVKRTSPNVAAPYTGSITALIVKGDTPQSTSLIVSANLSSIGGSYAVPMNDDGIYPDAVAGDNIFTGLADATAAPAGTYSIPITASDAQGRSTTSPLALRIREGVIPLGNLSSGSTLTGTGELEPRSLQWFSFTPTFDAAPPRGWVDLFTEAVPGSPIADTVLAVYTAEGLLVDSDDDSGNDLFSALSFGRSGTPRPPIGNGLRFDGRDGALESNSLLYVLVAQFRTTLASNFSAASSGLLAGQVRLRINGQYEPGLVASPSVIPSAVYRASPRSSLSTLFVSVGGDPSPLSPSTNIRVFADLTALGGSAEVELFDDGLGADAQAGDGTYSLPIDAQQSSTTPVIIPVRIVDAQGRTADASTALDVTAESLTDLGAVITDGVPRSYTLAAAQGVPNWLRLQIPTIAEPARWLDIHTGGSQVADSAIALYNSTGTIIAQNNDWSTTSNGKSGLSFGVYSPARSYPDMLPEFTGQTSPDLLPGTYYLAVVPTAPPFAATFASGFRVSSPSAAGGNITVTIAASAPPRSPQCLADVSQDGILDGTDFVLFINSFALGDASLNPLADLAGSGPDGLAPDGTIDGSDFVAFINAFALGC